MHSNYCTRKVNELGFFTDQHILDAVPPIHVVSNHAATDKLTTQNGQMFTN